jgi:hypothetical protein
MNFLGFSHLPSYFFQDINRISELLIIWKAFFCRARMSASLCHRTGAHSSMPSSHTASMLSMDSHAASNSPYPSQPIDRPPPPFASSPSPPSWHNRPAEPPPEFLLQSSVLRPSCPHRRGTTRHCAQPPLAASQRLHLIIDDQSSEHPSARNTGRATDVQPCWPSSYHHRSALCTTSAPALHRAAPLGQASVASSISSSTARRCRLSQVSSAAAAAHILSVGTERWPSQAIASLPHTSHLSFHLQDYHLPMSLLPGEVVSFSHSPHHCMPSLRCATTASSNLGTCCCSSLL